MLFNDSSSGGQNLICKNLGLSGRLFAKSDLHFNCESSTTFKSGCHTLTMEFFFFFFSFSIFLSFFPPLLLGIRKKKRKECYHTSVPQSCTIRYRKLQERKSVALTVRFSTNEQLYHIFTTAEEIFLVPELSPHHSLVQMYHISFLFFFSKISNSKFDFA